MVTIAYLSSAEPAQLIWKVTTAPIRVLLSTQPEPLPLHRCHEFDTDLEARFVADDAVDSASGAECGLTGAFLIFVSPFLDFIRTESGAAEEAPATLARLDLATMMDAASMRSDNGINMRGHVARLFASGAAAS